MLGALHEHYRFDTPSKLIYNGRTLECGDTVAAFESGNSRCRTPNVFAAGRMWDEAKNLRAVLEAAPKIAWPVRIAGDGAPLGRLDARGMARAYAESAIYLFPALYEPFGLSILEAALSGCALILGDIPSLREIWRDAAVFVRPRDPDAIARTVNEVIENEALLQELAMRARERAKDFSVDRMARGYRDVYTALSLPRIANRESRIAKEASV